MTSRYTIRVKIRRSTVPIVATGSLDDVDEMRPPVSSAKVRKLGEVARSASAAVTASFTAQAVLDAERATMCSGGQRTGAPEEAARLVSAPGYGEGARAMIFSDGTVQGALGGKGAPRTPSMQGACHQSAGGSRPGGHVGVAASTFSTLAIM